VAPELTWPEPIRAGGRASPRNKPPARRAEPKKSPSRPPR
jgi:hypothetical protein